MGLALGVAASASASPARPEVSYTTLDTMLPGQTQTGAVCTTGRWRCHAHVHVTQSGHIVPYAAPLGLGPADLQSAYNIDPNAIPATTPTIAIVDAYSYATLESDLATYRSTFGLPACTTANGCLKIVNQSGAASPLPAASPAGDDWTIETALDVDMASAACPKCKIVVIQADDDQGDGLFVANNVPATLGATVVSNSWGGPEQVGSTVTTYETYFNHSGMAVFVSAGDDGYNDAGKGPDYPGTSAYVIAVGGTSLAKAANTRGWTETAWSSGGSACSLSVPKPAYQTGTMCQYKATTDIAAVGDPQTGVAVYNKGTWQVVGGTSASSPLVAGIFAATGNGTPAGLGAFVKANASKLYDVTSGSNGACGNILCTAAAGWDGPTGYGTPNAAMLTAPGSGPGSGSGGSGSGSGGGVGGGGGGGGNGTGLDDNEVTGGCAAGGSGGGLALVLALGFVVVRRRR